MVGLLLSSVSKHYVVVIRLDLSSSVSKHNMWTYYGWVCRCCSRSVSTMHGQTGKLVGFVVVISQ